MIRNHPKALAAFILLALASALPSRSEAAAGSLEDIGFVRRLEIKDYMPNDPGFGFSPDGTKVIFRSSTKAKVFDLEAGKLVREIDIGDHHYLRPSPAGSLVAVTYNHGAKVWDYETGELVGEVRIPQFNATPFDFFPDGRALLLFNNEKGEYHRWEIGAKETVLAAKERYSNCVRVSPDGSKIAVDPYAGEVYDAGTGKKLHSLIGEDHLGGMAFSPDGEMIVTGGVWGQVILWNVATGKKIREFKGHARHTIDALAFSADGGLLVTGGGSFGDKSVRVWDVNTGENLATIMTDGSSVEQVLFSPDGQSFAMGVRDSGPFRIAVLATGRKGEVYIKDNSVALKSTTGRIVTLLPIGTKVKVETRQKGQFFVRAGKKLKGWISAKSVTSIKPDTVGPTVRIIEKSFDDPVLKIKGAVYDDERIVSVRFGEGGGTPVSKASFEVEKGNFGDVYPFEMKVTLMPGLKPQIVAKDRGGNEAKLVINIDEPIEDYLPLLSRLRVKSATRVRRGPDAAAKPILSLKKGAEMLAVGRKKGWFILEGGGWVAASSVKVLEREGPAPGTQSVTLKKKAESKPVLLSEGVDVPPAASAPADPDAVAVVIGIEKYRDVPGVDYAARDAMAVHAYLTKAMGYDERNVALLTDRRATKTDLSKYLGRWLENRATKESRVFVFFAGHGAPKPSTGDAYLIPYDGDPNYVEDTAIPLKRLYAQLSKLPAKEVTVVLDACFSGVGGRSVLAKGARPLVMKVAEKPRPGGRALVLSAASGAQISTFDPDAAHGLLTYYMLKGLKGEADTNGDKAITTKELFDFVRPNVERQARRQNVEQTPSLDAGSKDAAGPMGRVWLRLR